MFAEKVHQPLSPYRVVEGGKREPRDSIVGGATLRVGRVPARQRQALLVGGEPLAVMATKQPRLITRPPARRVYRGDGEDSLALRLCLKYVIDPY